MMLSSVGLYIAIRLTDPISNPALSIAASASRDESMIFLFFDRDGKERDDTRR